MNRKQRSALNFFAVFSIPALWWTIVVLGSLMVMCAMSFWTRQFPTHVPDFQFSNYAEIFSNTQYIAVLWRTLKITLMVCVFCFLIGFPLAYFISFKIKTARMRLVLYMATLIPVWVSYILRAYSWKTILGTEGVLNSFLIWIGIIEEPLTMFLFNQYAMVLTIGYICLPMMMLPMYAVMDKIPRDLIEASKDLGASSTNTFIHITLPLCIPGIIGGFTLAFCLAAGDFVSPILVGGPSGNLIANVLLTQYGMALNWPLGAAITVVILIVFVILLSLSNLTERHGRINIA